MPLSCDLPTPPNRFFIDESEGCYYDKFEIPKRSGGTRTVCAPSPALKAEQRRQLRYIEAMFAFKATEFNVWENFHGFIKGKSPVTAARKHIGYDVTIMMDIKDFFDNVKKTPVFDEINYYYCYTVDKEPYAAQGFVTSPMIANYYLIKPINEIKKILSLAGFDYALTVYADDIQISFRDVNYNELASVQNLVNVELNKTGLQINPKKTRIRWAKHGYRKILGISVGETGIKPSRKLLRKIRAARHQNNRESLGGLISAAQLRTPNQRR